MRHVVVDRGEDGYWVAECPCITQGEAREAAVVNSREASSAYVAALVEDNLRPTSRCGCKAAGVGR